MMAVCSDGRGLVGTKRQLPSLIILLFFFFVIPFTLAESPSSWPNDISNDDDIPDDWVDYRDMMNYDMSTKSMKNDAALDRGVGDRSVCPQCPPCLCPNVKADGEEDDKSSGGNGNVDQSLGAKITVDNKAASSTSPLSGNATTVGVDETCRAESELSLVCMSTFRKLIRLIVDASVKTGITYDEEAEEELFEASFRLPAHHMKVLKRVVGGGSKKESDDGEVGTGGPACRDIIWAVQHLSASIEKVERQGKSADEAASNQSGNEWVLISMDDVRGKSHLFYWAVSALAGLIGKAICQ